MLTELDDSPWHQLPTTFDHVGTSDPRFFDRLWFAASDRQGHGALQFTMGVYQNMNVVDGGFVVIIDGVQHNLRVSRQLRPRYESRLRTAAHRRARADEADRAHRSRRMRAASRASWSGPRPIRRRRNGRTTPARTAGSSRTTAATTRSANAAAGSRSTGRRIEVDSWWSCRDHSWGVRERVGIPEPVTGPRRRPAAIGGGLFAFLFYSTADFAGHVQVTRRPRRGLATLDRRDRRPPTTGDSVLGERVGIDAEFVDDGRPRRVRNATGST